MTRTVRTVDQGCVKVQITMDTDRLERMMADAMRGGTLDMLVQKAAFDVERSAKLICPVDTGNLANSIRAENVEHAGTATQADIAPHTEYSFYVEMGHRTRGGGYVPGRHYMENALKREAPKLQAAVNKWVRMLDKR